MLGQPDLQKDQSILDIDNQPIKVSIQKLTVSFDLIQLEEVLSGIQTYPISKERCDNLFPVPSSRLVTCSMEDNISTRPSISKTNFIVNEEFSPDSEDISHRDTASSSIRAEAPKRFPEPFEQYSSSSLLVSTLCWNCG